MGLIPSLKRLTVGNGAVNIEVISNGFELSSRMRIGTASKWLIKLSKQEDSSTLADRDCWEQLVYPRNLSETKPIEAKSESDR
jgi:hypothetical protein